MGSIQERTNKKGERNYTAIIRMMGHRTACKTFKRHTDAKAWMMQQEVKIQQGLYIETSEARKHSLGEAVARFLREESLHPYREAHLHEWERALGSRTFLSAVNEIQIDDIASKWRVTGPVDRPLQPATLNRYLSSLSLLFDAARRWGWVRKNPVRDARKFQEPSGRVRFLSDEERTTLLEVCRNSTYDPLELVVLLALSTGMRRGELMSLRWSQVDLSDGAIVLTKTKNKTQRRVYVRGKALELLQDHGKVRRIDTDFLFPGERTSPVTAHQPRVARERHFDIRKPWKRALAEAKIKNFRFHDLRHSCASYLAMCGASNLEIAEVLGHKTLEMVKRYAHLSNTHVATVVERMNVRFLAWANG